MDIKKDQLIAAAKKEREKRIAEAEAAFQRDLESIDRVIALQDQSPNVIPSNGKHPSELHIPLADDAPRRFIHRDWPGFPVAIAQAVSAQSDTFGLDSVLNYIVARYPNHEIKRVDISRELWRLKERKLIIVVEGGAGKRPAVYRKPQEVQKEERV